MKPALAIPVLILVSLPACAQTASPAQSAPPPSSSPQAVELDHVIAIIGTNVILQSDVQQEIRLASLEPLGVAPGQNTPDYALRRLIDRTLILEQMQQQLQPVFTPAPELEKSIAQLRKEIPACEQYHCDTPEGWSAFLASRSLTPTIVNDRWSQRTAMLKFIDLRFRSGIRVSQDQIAAYYQNTLVPALTKEHENVPSLQDVSPRIQEILLQQQVSGLFQDWLSSLRDQGNIRIVDPAYSALLDNKSTDSSQ